MQGIGLGWKLINVMSKKEKSAPSILASGLKDSLESLQASLDEWAAVENEVKDAPAKSKPAENQSKATDKELMNRLMKQIESLSL